jgi:hypothetical protein
MGSNGKRWDRQWAIKKIADFSDSKEEEKRKTSRLHWAWGRIVTKAIRQ